MQTGASGVLPPLNMVKQMVKHSSENGAKKALWRVSFRTRKKKNER